MLGHVTVNRIAKARVKLKTPNTATERTESGKAGRQNLLDIFHQSHIGLPVKLLAAALQKVR